ncbi:tRNA-Phe hydroxylase [Aureococcus anophagefferens]|nr:tRNA-Phe hydroxylase [Aureococcus anophagefferens]
MRLRLLIACVAVGRAAVPDTCDHRNPTCDACCPAPGGVKCVDASSAEDLDFSGRTACVCYDGDAASQTVTGSDFNDCLFVTGDYAVVDAGEGDDVVILGEGKDGAVDGGPGRDEIFVFRSGEVLGDEAVYVEIEGGEGDDLIVGEGEALSIDAGPGNDYVELGTSASTNLDRNRVWGGEGKDMLMIWNVKNSLISAGPPGGGGCLPGDEIDIRGSASLTVAGSACDDYIDLVDVDDSDVDAGAGDDVVNVRGQYNDLYGGDGDDILYYSGEQTTIGDFEKKTLADPFLSGDEDEALDDGTYSYSYRDRLAPYYDYYYYYYEAGAASPSAPSPAPTAEAPEAPEAGGEAVGPSYAPTTLYAPTAKPTADAAGGAAPEAPAPTAKPTEPVPAPTAKPTEPVPVLYGCDDAVTDWMERNGYTCESYETSIGLVGKCGDDDVWVAAAACRQTCWDAGKAYAGDDCDAAGGAVEPAPPPADAGAPPSPRPTEEPRGAAPEATPKPSPAPSPRPTGAVDVRDAVSLWDAEDDGDQGHYASSRRDTYRDT